MAAQGHVPMRLLTSHALSRRVTAGDSRAFGELFRRHQEALYRFCVSVLGNPEDAGDALQNTMAKALRSLPGEVRDLNLKPWLFRVAHNECIDLIRARRHTEDITEHEVASSAGVESTVVTRERLRQVLDDLGHLPERQRGALVMRELNGLSFDEIGRALDSSPGAAKQQVYEARCALQEQSEGHNMDCETARRLISEGDGRVTGGRKVKAHLRTCDSCGDFKAGIQARSRDLRSLVPPIPAVLAMSLAGITGGAGGGGGLAAMLGIGGGGAAVGGGAMKAVTIVAIAAGVGAGTVGVVEGTRDSGSSRDIPAKVSESVLPTGANVSGATGGNSAAGVATGVGRGQGPGKPGNGPPDRPLRDGRPGAPGNGPPAGVIPGNGSQTVPLVPVVPGKQGPPTNPGDSGGANGSGATPAPGGRPADLPAASDEGQAQAESSSNSTPGRPPEAGPPASPGASGKTAPARPGHGNQKDP